ncbi:protein of unknown function [Brochothrix thermosphacta]|uniref:Uncharacterized protein n=1 Tax=Brochothrix thermosphacta TaxID=2756 RepID=A0A2X0RUE3_BROTH|nr:hypothetical protein BTH160X_120025 [Brochothrix thermosphacta]SPN71267.1 protein of unknown function [Brochothrix thermosphacta]SPN74671.1 conserved hypothetical protein [Brochothrix thermosphacta]SPP26125.1 conserved hypothetical protein [Brochothrix thermosphacta]
MCDFFIISKIIITLFIAFLFGQLLMILLTVTVFKTFNFIKK